MQTGKMRNVKTAVAAIAAVLSLAAAGGPAKPIDVSRVNPRYFAAEDGKTWIPVGCNICFSRIDLRAPVDHEKVRADFNRWLRAFAANGGNCIRIWAGHKSLEIMPEQAGVFDPEAEKTVTGIVRLCEELGIKIKVTLESFRSVRPAGDGDAPIFHRPLYLPYAADMNAFLASEECFRVYMAKAARLRDLGLGDSPAVYCWEPWNEINSIAPISGYAPWSDRVLAALREMFPRQLVVQNLGSFSEADGWRMYDQLATVENNDFLQIHRYLDPGAAIDDCRGPMDVVAASATRELLSRRPDKPAIVAEVGAVKRSHTGPCAFYPQDKDGVLLHDEIFAPFFSGSAGSGQPWHWDWQYIDGNGLWWQFGRFAKAIEGLDPVAENFVPFRTETRRLRLYGLQGGNVTAIWCRDKRNSWEDEFVRGDLPELLCAEEIPFYGCELECYDPWTDRRQTVPAPRLPPFRRSLVIFIRHHPAT